MLDSPSVLEGSELAEVSSAAAVEGVASDCGLNQDARPVSAAGG